MERTEQEIASLVAPNKIRAEVKRLRDLYSTDREISREMDNLRRYLARMSPEASAALYELLGFLGVNGALGPEEVDAGLEQYAANGLNTKKELAHAMHPLVEWWKSQGLPVTKTLWHQNATGRGNSPLIDFLVREHEVTSGRKITPTTARYIVDQMGRV